MTEFSAYASTNTIVAGDSILVVRAGIPYRFTGTLPGIDASGNLGIGTNSPSKRIEAQTTTNADGIGLSFKVAPTAANGAAVTFSAYTNTAVLSDMAQFQAVCTDGSASFGSSLIFRTATAGALTEKLRIDAAGNLLLGYPTGSNHIIARGATEGDTLLNVTGTLHGGTIFYSGITGASAAATCLVINKRTSTGRSINAAGTVNASGADYAEYMTKAEGCGVIAKGDVCGVDADGRLTRKWADAISYVVKSTEPGYRGGDTWGIGLEGADLEAARQKVDSIAFCGQVPVNVTGECAAGDYIIAAANGTGIKAIAVPESEITFEQYRRRIGKVWAIRDGRPIIDVQHG